MNRVLLVAGVLAIAAVAVTAPTNAATKRSASTLCVGGGGCYSTIQAAVDAAHEGDTIKLNPGTFAGGVQVPKSLNIVGAGAGRTVIRGGGPVLTLGTLDAPTQPAAISIRGVTIMGGVNTGAAPDYAGAHGGGVLIPAAVGASDTFPGASVTIADSVIAGNRVQPSGSTDFGISCPDGFVCPGAFAGGAGIESHGNLTLVNTIVSDNRAVTDTGYAGGGGVRQIEGSLTMRHSVVTRNQSVVTPPHGIYPWGAGVIVDGGSGAVVISDSVISDNTVSMTSVYPVGPGTGASGAALDFDESHTGPVTVTDTRITGNIVSGSDPAGDGSASAIVYVNSGSPLTMRNTVISGNHVIASGATGVTGGVIFATNSQSMISNMTLTGNTTSVTSTGDATGYSAFDIVSAQPSLVIDSVFAGNTTRVSGQTTANIYGVGMFNGGVLQLRRTRVTDNTGRADGQSGTVDAGGILNNQLFDELLPQLTLTDSLVARNSISGSAGLTVHGGGISSTFPVTLQHSLITQNTPDQCFGC